MLEDDESWEALKEDIRDYIETLKAKNKGCRTVKPSTIMIVDLSSSKIDGNNAKVHFFCINIRLELILLATFKGAKSCTHRKQEHEPSIERFD